MAPVASVAIFAVDWILWRLVLFWCLAVAFGVVLFIFFFFTFLFLGMAVCWILSSIGVGVLALFLLVSGMWYLQFFDFIFCL